MLFCPIRVQRRYLAELKSSTWLVLTFSSQQLRGRNGRPKTISFWIILVISHAHGSAADGDCRAVKVKAHKVQMIVTSLLF